MYIKKYWGNFIGGSDDSLNLVAFLVDQKKEEIPLSEIFAKIGLDKQNWDFRQTVEYLEFTHSNGVEMDFHFAIDVVTDLAAILLECGISGSAYPGLDMISFGPTICYPHSPDEKVEIASVGKFYDFLVDTLRNVPEK